jgi:hypothetical protein
MEKDRQEKRTPHLPDYASNDATLGRRTGNEDCIDTPDVSPGKHLTPEGLFGK